MANKSRVYGDEVIQEIIHRYIETYDITGEIEYSSVRDFAFQLWKENDPIFSEKLYYRLVDNKTGEVSDKIYKNIKLSDDFWRKPQYQGRQKIDAANDILSKTVAKTENRQVNIPNVDFVLEKYKNNLNQLRLNLKPLEEQLKNSIAIEDKLEKKVQQLEEQIQKLKAEKVKLTQQNRSLQDALYKMFEYSASSDVPLENQLNTGKGKTKRVAQALREAFADDPNEFYLHFKSKNNDKKEGIVSNIDKYKKQKVAKLNVPKYEDEYDFE
ncbi:hypothetical protein [Pallidibacillus thermolactis]|jgi:chromosome segregation ATPase|uniref:hypothetical protein n=1 Tax=Pallidibacillus thermolactis TaxID=251051 RepID=UPI0021DB3F57|nr:hypothetical protein [Pallidibacillus thermolactis]MCU9599901.1 hypothetical protein [Pallidibacillus thermolactis subsp. kokeshiiformis]